MRARKKKNVFDFPVIGKVKVGMRNAKGWPTSLDYFRFAPVTEDGNMGFVKVAETLFPHSKQDKRNLLPIYFSSDSENNMDNFFELRNGKGDLVAKYDAQFIQVKKTDRWEAWFLKNGGHLKAKQKDRYFITFDKLQDFGEDKGLGKFDQFMQAMEDRTKAQSRKPAQIKWQEVLVMRFVLHNYPTKGRWEFRTKAEATTIEKVLDAYDLAKEMAGGSIVNIPFALTVEKVKSSKGNQFPIVTITPLTHQGGTQSTLQPFKTESLALGLGRPQNGNEGTKIDDNSITFDDGPHLDNIEDVPHEEI